MPPRPFIPAPNTASCELIYQASGDVYENVFHVYKGSPFTLAQLQSLRAVANTWDGASAANLRWTGSQLYRIRTKALDSLASPFEDYFLPAPRAGGGPGGGTGANTAFCVKLSTGLTGRSYRGRWYFGAIPAGTLLDTGHVTVAYQANYANALQALIANLATAGYTMCVSSFRADKAWRAAVVNTQITTAVAIDNALDSQRRRLPGRGH